jgi:hypothetical protein
VALAALVIASSFASTSARAGGWWSSIDLNGRHISIGETVNARAEVLFRTLQVARDARTTEYYAYLARGVDTNALECAMSQPEPRSRASSPPWVPYVAWFVTAVVIAAALRRRRSDPVTEHRAAPEQVPDDTRELVSR